MPLNDTNADAQRSDLVFLLKEVKLISPLIGSYIEHFHFTDNVIIVKLTNGFIKVEEKLLEKFHTRNELLNALELKKIGDTFEKTLL
jgi:hypothetical protein